MVTEVFPDTSLISRYVSLDLDGEGFDVATEWMMRARCVAPECVIGDATKQTLFDDGSFDVAIISDVTSVPEQDWCMCGYDCTCDCASCECSGFVDWSDDGSSLGNCCDRVTHGLSYRDKTRIIRECVRLLVSGGTLVVATHQTHEEARFIHRDLNNAEWLAKEGLVLLRESDRRWVSMCDLRGSFEAQYTKQNSA